MSDATYDHLPDDVFEDDAVLVDGVPGRDWRVLIEYASGEAAAEAAAQVEHRLQTDPTFAAFAAPILVAWTVPMTPATEPSSDADAHTGRIRDKDAGWAEIQRKAAALRAARAADVPVPPLRLLETSEAAQHVSSATPRHPSATPAARRSRPSAVGRWRSPRPIFLALAACLVIALGLRGVYGQRHPGLSYHAAATSLAVTLPDGTHAVLEPGSYLGTNPDFPNGTRTVFLFGAAHFTVAQNSRVPFIVNAIGLRATALGTSFDVRGDTVPRVAVHVLEGKVALDLVDDHGHVQHLAILTAGDVRNVPALSTWFLHAGYIVAGAGIPIGEAHQINDALLRAAAAIAPR